MFGESGRGGGGRKWDLAIGFGEEGGEGGGLGGGGG